jgi:hypothetical protein
MPRGDKSKYTDKQNARLNRSKKVTKTEASRRKKLSVARGPL